jgi:ABC-type glycerol-3-phosphate transport system substrate-binding protein
MAVVAAAAAGALALAGCSSGGGSSGDSGSVKGQTITYWATLQGTGAAQTTKTLTTEFAKFTKQTGVKVDLEVIPWTTLQTRILNAVTSGDGADVMEIGNTWAPSLAASGGFLQFSPQVLDEIGGKSKFVQSSFSESGLPGQTPMSVPVYATTYSLAYNKADFKAAGISSPPATWTAATRRMPPTGRSSSVSRRARRCIAPPASRTSRPRSSRTRSRRTSACSRRTASPTRVTPRTGLSRCRCSRRTRRP